MYKKGEEKHFTTFVLRGEDTSEAEEILKEINWKNKTVIDIGCGTGRFAYLATKKGANVLGIDYSHQAIKIAKRKFRHPNLKFQQFDVNKKIPGKYDVIVSIGTLEHMDDPFQILKQLKKNLKSRGKIIITAPNWTNPRGYILIPLYFLFNASITLADLHYLSPIDFMEWAKKLNMHISWRTFDRSWAHGEVLIDDLKRRIPKVLKDSNLPCYKKRINLFLKWLKSNVLPFNNSLTNSGAIGIYIFSISNPKK